MDYKSTVNLPKTDFPMKANLPQQEPEILRLWEEQAIFQRIVAQNAGRAGAKRFVLHDGPPYANGDIHIGHALDKILKDIVVTYRNPSHAHVSHGVFYRNAISPLNDGDCRYDFPLVFDNVAGGSAPVPTTDVAVKNDLFDDSDVGDILFYYIGPARQEVLGTTLSLPRAMPGDDSQSVTDQLREEAPCGLAHKAARTPRKRINSRPASALGITRSRADLVLHAEAAPNRARASHSHDQ